MKLSEIQCLRTTQCKASAYSGPWGFGGVSHWDPLRWKNESPWA